MKTRPGKPYPLGATWDGAGVNFAIFSERAEGVELCLFDSPRSEAESSRIAMSERTDMVWHVYVEGIGPRQLYGYRAHGRYEPKRGDRFNPAKVLLDPYAKAIGRPMRWGDELFAYPLGDDEEDLVRDDRDNAALAPLAAVVDPAFSQGDDRKPDTPWHHTLIYETHVKGFTARHPEIPESLRGTYVGLASEPAIEHLKSLGVTAVELMPIHQHAIDGPLVKRGLSNYWGYNTLAYLAPDVRFASERSETDPLAPLREFRQMVADLHRAGIEVILDVVYNHTCEGDHLGPTLSLRGLDNAEYYRLEPNDPRFYQDFTGCGNTLNMQSPRVLQLIMDSLRYWVTEMGVDGFRFDLASALARELHAVDRLSAFFDIIHQDPTLSQVKLIAEPWDLGEGGYQVGEFPVGWAEWNGKYRECARKFWRGDGDAAAELATRLTGSSDLYADDGRRPHASVNYVTCHDGFTLADLVSYNEKHNEANRDGGESGDDHNLSWNCGAEGPTDDTDIRALRWRQMRNFITTLVCSQGVPMLSHGDEIARTQMGNNNAYCQDNEISWIDWSLDDERRMFLDFVRRAVALWREQPALRRRKFFHGRSIRGAGVKDIVWLRPDGGEMTDEDWSAEHCRCLGVRLAGDRIDEVDEQGEPVRGDTLLMLFNAHDEPIEFTTPGAEADERWALLIDTADPDSSDETIEGGAARRLVDRSVVVFRRTGNAESDG